MECEIRVNLSTMTQVNKTTGTLRKVRRCKVNEPSSSAIPEKGTANGIRQRFVYSSHSEASDAEGHPAAATGAIKRRYVNPFQQKI